MAAAFAWGTLAASSLVIGALVALRYRIELRDRADLGLRRGRADQRGRVRPRGGGGQQVPRSRGGDCGPVRRLRGLLRQPGSAIDHFGGADRKEADGSLANGSALAIVLGTVLDRMPEPSMVIGLTIFQGGAVGAAYLTAVFISNLPESISSTSGLRTGGWEKSPILWMWIAIAVISGLASLAGYGLFQHSSPGTVAFVLAFAEECDPHHARGHDRAEARRRRRRTGRGRDDARIRDHGHDPSARSVTGRHGADSGSPPGRVGGSHEEDEEPQDQDQHQQRSRPVRSQVSSLQPRSFCGRI